MLKNLLFACVCLCLSAGGLRAQSGDRDFVAAARKTMQNYEKAVITLSAVLRSRCGASRASANRSARSSARPW